MDKLIERLRKEKEEALPEWSQKGRWEAERWLKRARHAEIKEWAATASSSLPEWNLLIDVPSLPEDIYEEWKSDRRVQPEIVPEGDEEIKEYARGFYARVEEAWEEIADKI